MLKIVKKDDTTSVVDVETGAVKAETTDDAEAAAMRRAVENGTFEGPGTVYITAKLTKVGD